MDSAGNFIFPGWDASVASTAVAVAVSARLLCSVESSLQRTLLVRRAPDDVENTCDQFDDRVKAKLLSRMRGNMRAVVQNFKHGTIAIEDLLDGAFVMHTL